jgi:hypothetical protein
MPIRATQLRSLVGLGLAVLLAGAPGAAGEKKPKPPKGKKAGTASVTVTFTTDQRDAVRGWYAEKYGRSCPPGLAKKNNGCLPPGQAKKRYAVGHPLPPGIVYGPVPPDLAVRIGAPPSGYVYASLDGDLLKLAVGTLLVVDAIGGLVD